MVEKCFFWMGVIGDLWHGRGQRQGPVAHAPRHRRREDSEGATKCGVPMSRRLLGAGLAVVRSGGSSGVEVNFFAKGLDKISLGGGLRDFGMRGNDVYTAHERRGRKNENQRRVCWWR